MANLVPSSTSTDPEIELLIPANDVAEPELSIVIPALNEQLTITDFVAWCHEGMKKAGVVGEILIIDSGSDSTTELALAGGARVLRTPKRGLGRAYIDALPFIRGRYIVMGDADCTYDFRELAPFVEKFRGGAEFIMGSRFRGFIEPGSMPPLHRYLGTPVTTAILNVIFGSRFSDIHCGMRGITKAALGRMDLRSQSWEYASEMVLKSVHMNLRTEEVPIRFLKDRDGRLSHHKRSGWFSPWAAAWINLRAMFVYGADFFLYKPGLISAGGRPLADAAAVVRDADPRAGHLRSALDAARACRSRSSGFSASTWGSCRRSSSTGTATSLPAGSAGSPTIAPWRSPPGSSAPVSSAAGSSPAITSTTGFSC